jgi:predicted DNA-binding transcriptional regulator
MSKDQMIGVILLLGSILGIILYGWLLFFFAPQLMLQITAFVVIAGILGIVGWIGYTLATTPPPQPIEDLTKDMPPPPPEAKEEPSEAKP